MVALAKSAGPWPEYDKEGYGHISCYQLTFFFQKRCPFNSGIA